MSKKITLKEKGIFRDGGTTTYRGSDGKEYYIYSKLGSEEFRNKLFIGEFPKDRPSNETLAKGTFYIEGKSNEYPITVNGKHTGTSRDTVTKEIIVQE